MPPPTAPGVALRERHAGKRASNVDPGSSSICRDGTPRIACEVAYPSAPVAAPVPVEAAAPVAEAPAPEPEPAPAPVAETPVAETPAADVPAPAEAASQAPTR